MESLMVFAPRDSFIETDLKNASDRVKLIYNISCDGDNAPKIVEQSLIQLRKSHWMSRLQQTFEQGDLSLVVAPENNQIIIDIPTNLPEGLRSGDLHALILLDEVDSCKSILTNFFDKKLSTWQLHLYNEDNFEEFFANAGDGNGLVIVNEQYLSQLSPIKSHFNRHDLNTVIVSQDATLLDPTILYLLGSDPLITEFPIDVSAIGQALELTVMRHVLSQIQQPKLSLPLAS